MRLIVETIDHTQYLELILNEEEWERIRKRGICTEFTGTELEKRFLNIFVRTEQLEEFYAVEEGKESEGDFGEYF